MPDRESVRVVAAVIERGGRWLVGRRPIGKRHGGLWEFPGGKVNDGETTLDAAILLERLLLIEASQGRSRGRVANLARTLDLDLLLWGDCVIDLPGLVVPHPRMHQRSFVLDPLCDLVPDAVHPLLGETIAALAQRARDPDGGP